VAVDLAELVNPTHTAVLTMELQRGVVGDLAPLAELAAEAADGGIVAATARLLAAARGRNVPVVHCTAEYRADRAGSATNAPLLTAMARFTENLVAGSPSAAILPELGAGEGDLIAARAHGVSPFGGTSLDATLRNLRISTVVATGVSLNLGVTGLAIEAVNLGYRVVVATDAVCGFPRDYAEAVLHHTIALVATRATVAELIATWG
jgi:nicotinamidase-related amidase